MIRYLIWDMDGTLFDTYPAIAGALGAALDDLGSSAPLDWIESLAKQSVSHCISTLVNKFNVGSEELRERFERRYASIPSQEQPLFPGVIDVCEYARSIGGTNVIVTHRGRESTNRFLTVHNMTHYFADSLTRDDNYPRKPNPTSFEAMIKKHNFKRKETLAIGDRDIDILAGQASGVRTCFFGVESSKIPADYTITDFAVLHRIMVTD